MISGPVNCKPGLLSRGSISAFGSKPNSVALSLVSNIGMPMSEGVIVKNLSRAIDAWVKAKGASS